jgi:ribA/ribD-fused uncharacterized protein
MIKQFSGEYRWLSNFALVNVVFEGVVYPSIEHAYVAAKTTDPEFRKEILNPLLAAGTVKVMGRGVKVRNDWDNIKLTVMEDLVRQKFNQEPFKTKLIETSDEYIQEGNYWGDSYWGVNMKTGDGMNHLGELIMMIRRELRGTEGKS